MRGRWVEMTLSGLGLSAIAAVGVLLFGVKTAVTRLDDRLRDAESARAGAAQADQLAKVEERLARVEQAGSTASRKADQLTTEVAAMRTLLAEMHKGSPPQKTDPVLKTAYILPVPPVNIGRMVQYESYVAQRDDRGEEVIIFREWLNGRLTETRAPSTAVQWARKE